MTFLLFILRLTSYSEWLQTADLYAYIIGAWAGCVVIPLDWQRKWQAWPIPNILAGLFFQGVVTILGPCIYRMILKRQGVVVEPGAKRAAPGKRAESPKKAAVTPSPKKSARSPSPAKKAAKSPRLPRKCTFLWSLIL